MLKGRQGCPAVIGYVEGMAPARQQVFQDRLVEWVVFGEQDVERPAPGRADLASVRDRPALDRLPENERAAWQALWRDVDELARQLEKKAD